MAENNNLEEIQSNFDNIAQILDSMRAQNAMNAGDLEKVLANISFRLEGLSNDDNAELVKVFLAEMKRSLDERHNFVSSKFADMEESFKALSEKTGDELDSGEIKELFDIIATNLNVFSKEVVSQKDILSDINLRLEDLKQDDSQKKDILRNISVLKVEIEKFNNGFESIVINLNDNFKNLSQALLKLDSTESISSIKKDIENIFLSSNAVLSALQLIDKKNKDLEEFFDILITKEDFESQSKLVSELIEKNVTLTQYIEGLPKTETVDNLSQKIDTAVGVINALKTVLNDTSAQNQQLLTAQLEYLETKISNILSEDDFKSFRYELSNLVSESIQSANLMRTDLLETNGEIRNLLSYLNSLDIKVNFQQLTGVVKSAEDNVKASIWELSNKFSKESEQHKNLITTDINANIQNVSQRIEMMESSMSETASAHLTSIIENIKSVLESLSSVRNSIHVDNLQNIDVVEAKLLELKEDLASSKEVLSHNSEQNLETIVSNFAEISRQLGAAKEGIEQKAQENIQGILTSIAQLFREINMSKEGLIEHSEQNLSQIKEKFDGISEQISTIKEEVIQNNQLQTSDFASTVETLAQRLERVKDGINEISQNSVDSVRVTVQGILDEVEGAKVLLSGKTDKGFEGLSVSVSEVARLLSSIKLGLEDNSKLQAETIKADFSELSNKISLITEWVHQTSEGNMDDIKSVLSAINDDYEVLKNELKEISHSDVLEVKSFIDALYAEFEGVKTALGVSNKLNLDEIKAEFSSVKEELSSVKELSSQEISANTARVKAAIDSLLEEVEESKEELSLKSQSNLESITNSVESLGARLYEVKSELKLKSQSNLEDILENINRLFAEFELVKENLNQISQANLEHIAENIKEVSEKIEATKNSINTDFADNLSKIREELSELPSVIRQNQSIYEQEKQTLIEQNSRNIEEVAQKIENLTQGILTKDNPFKEEVLAELSSFKEFVESIEGSLKELNSSSMQDLKAGFKNVESLILQGSGSYDMSLFNLQTKLSDYLVAIQEITSESDSKLENSAKELEDIKSEIKAVSTDVSVKFSTSENKLSELSEEILTKFDEILSGISDFEDNSRMKNQEAIEQTVQKIDSEFEKVLDSLSEQKEIFDDSSKDFVAQLEEKIEILKEQINLAGTDVSTALSAQTVEIVNAFSPLKNAIDELKEVDFDKIILDVKNQIESSSLALRNSLMDSADDNKTEILDNISRSFEEFNSKIYQDFSTKIEGISESLKEEPQDFSEYFDKLEEFITNEGTHSVDVIKISIQDILNKLSGVSSTCSSVSELVSLKSEELQSKIDELEIVTKGVSEVVGVKTDELLDELVSVKSDLIDEISSTKEILKDQAQNQIECLKEELKSVVDGIVNAQDELQSHKLDIADLLKIKDEDLKSQISQIEDKLVDEIQSNIGEFKTAVENTVDLIGEKIDLSEENYTTSVKGLLSDIKTSFYDNVNENLDDLKSFIEVLTNRNDNTLQIDNLKSDLFDEFSKTAQNIEESLTSISVKDELENLNVEIQDSISNLMENLYDKVLIALEDNKLTQDVFSKTEEIARRIEDLKNSVTEDITEKLDGFELTIDKQAQDFSNLVEEIKVSIADLKESYIDLSVNSSAELSNLLVGIDEKISKVDGQLNDLDFSSLMESAKEDLTKQFDSLKDEGANLKLELEAINQKLDVLSMSPSEDDLERDVQEIKETIKSQTELLQDLKSLDNLDKLSKIDGIIVIQAEIKKILANFDGRLKALSSEQVENKPQAEDIKSELAAVKKEVVESILTVFDQVSFVVEAEDIKDFVEEKAEEINENIKSSLGNNFSNIISSLGGLTDLASSSDERLQEIKKDINSLKNHLEQISEQDEGGYTYTLQDVESDIAKLRLILNDISQTAPSSNIDKLNEDIMSISTRTNKLLLTSDESYNTLKENLTDFKETIYKLEERAKYLDNTESNKRIEKKVDNINSLVLSSVNSDKTFDQAFMYLAEWIDKADENISGIMENVSDLGSVKMSVEELKRAMPKKSELELMFLNLGEKFEQQQDRIEILEQKIEKLAQKSAAKSKDVDLKSIVAEVLAQVGTIEAKPDLKMSKKVDSIDKQLTKLSKSIEKLTTYVE